MNPILYIIYHFLKLVVRVSVWVFYAKMTVIHRERGNFTNPCIVVSNHPSTVLDPLNAAVRIDRIVFFLANASLFKIKFFAWLLNHLYCIPIERYEDTGGKPLNNKASFEKSTQHLKKGGCMYIAPEGTSYVQRRLRKLKTGTARIAFTAESLYDFQLGLTILPIGLNYSDPTQFRSTLLTIFGEPIRVADFKNEWETDAFEGVRKLTDHLEEKLSALIIDTQDEEEDKLLKALEVILQNKHALSPLDDFRRSKTMLDRLRREKVADPARYGKLSETAAAYFQKLKTLKLGDKVAHRRVHVSAPGILGLVLAQPLFLLGYLSHFLPAFFAKKINDWLNDDIHWMPTYKYVAGLVTFPLLWGLQIWLVHRFGGQAWLTWLYAFSIVPSGLVAEWFLKKWRQTIQRLRVRFYQKRNPVLMEDLMANKEVILSECERLLAQVELTPSLSRTL